MAKAIKAERTATRMSYPVIAKDKRAAALDVVDRKAKRVYLLGAVVLAEIGGFVAKFAGDIFGDRAVSALDAGECLVRGVPHVARRKGTEFRARRGFGAVGNLVFGFGFFRRFRL
jgi:hypothetical protein